MSAPVIACMWGTTQLHAFLITGPGEPAVRNGPGVARVRGGDFETVLAELVGDWLGAHPAAPVVLAGMIGSSMGWRDTGYLDCPARPEDAVRAGVDVSLRGRPARIIRGLACMNAMGEPDVLRGEETEILGWATLTPGATAGARLLCIPGTHAKWVVVRDGVVRSFLSSAAGELFAALSAEGVLTDRAEDDFSTEVFASAVRDAAADEASLPHLLFTARSRVLRGALPREHAASRLSGLIVGADVAGATRLLAEPIAAAGLVTVIGMPQIGARYRDALKELGVATELLDTRTAAAAGLRRAAEVVFEREAGA